MKTTATIIADFDTTTDSTINIGGTTLTLDSIIDNDGTTLPNGRYFFTLDLWVKREYISGDIIGKAVSNIKHISRQGVESTGVTIQHNRGVACVISGFPHLVAIQKLIEGSVDLNSLTPIKYDWTATISNANHIATKAYTDSKTYTTPTTDASTSVFGVRKVSVAPVSATNPIEVTTTDPRIPTQGENDAMVGTSGTPSSSNKYATQTDTQFTGNLETSWAQTVAWIKTFTSIPLVVWTPTNWNDMINLTYLNSL